MKRLKEGRAFWVCVVASLGLHLVLLASRAPVVGPKQVALPAPEFRMIQAALVKANPPPPTPVKPREEPSRKPVNEAAVVREEQPAEEPAPVPPLIEPPKPEPAQEPLAEHSGAVADAGSADAGSAQGGATGGSGGDTFMPFYQVDARPDYAYRAPLEYPAQARRLGKEGSVIIEADIDAKGLLHDSRVIKKAGFGFDEAALAMVRASKFTPAYAAGRPVAVRMRFTIHFKLKG